MKKLALATALAVYPVSAFGGGADVVDVKAIKSGNGTWNFSVTVKHGDEGWDHYADKWEVVGPDGKVFATRVLAHPHVNEQPFTRSKSGVKIPEGIDQVTIRAGDSVHGLGGKEMVFKLEE